MDRWIADSKQGRKNLEDEPRKRGPKSALTPEITAKIQAIILEDRQLTERCLVGALGISVSAVSIFWPKDL